MESAQVVVFNPDKTITLNDEALHRILMREEVRDRYISVISVTGVFRQGKSFLLNFFLRYLRIKYIDKHDVTAWLQPEHGPLNGFCWSSGSRRHTTGIHMWPEVFLTQLPTGEEVAIILLDTQGAFDNQSTVDDCATIFTLSTLISSTQIYNVMRGIKQYDFTHLQCFGGYGRLISTTGQSPFQNLWFLIRDWACPYEKPYGVEGGAQLMEDVFNVGNKTPELRTQADNIQELFKKISCFLLPYPGRTVDTCANFNGDLTDIDEDFLKHVQDFVEMILAPENLVLKSIHGETIKAGDLVAYIEEYTEILKEGKLPKMETVFKATVEAHHKAAAFKSLKLYKKIMDCDCKYNPKSFSEMELAQKHSITKLKAVDLYGKTKKMEDDDINEKYLLQLRNSMDEEFVEYKKVNAEKVRDRRERRRMMQEQIQLARGEGGQGGNLSTLSIAEKAGTAAAVIGGIAVLAFGASKLFTSSKGNQD